uniref:Integral membrane protein n=1 Tax=Moniliophthora roreri TaxID=221103 RepID=A0A0W0GE52_MONRR
MADYTEASGATVYDIKRLVATTSVHFFLYGIFAVLFGICLRYLFKDRRQYRIHILAIAFLFIPITLHLVFTTILDTVATTNHTWNTPTRENLKTGQLVLVTLTNGIADAILIWRCYLVWGRRFKVIAFPAFVHLAGFILVMSTLGQGYIILLGASAYFSRGACSNQLKTVGRIVYLSQDFSPFLPSRTKKMYRSVIAISIESGLLYTLSAIVNIIVYIIFGRTNNGLPVTALGLAMGIMLDSWPLFAGISQTLIIVQTAMGVSIDRKEREKDVSLLIPASRTTHTIVASEES